MTNNTKKIIFQNEPLYTSNGVLRYTRYDDGFRLTVEVDQGIADFYRSLIPKSIMTCRQRWGAHITVVRYGKEVPQILDYWGLYDGEEIEFCYSPIVHSGKVYFWLNAFCLRLEDIRKELGLPVSSLYTLPPEGFEKCFHITIANCKN